MMLPTPFLLLLVLWAPAFVVGETTLVSSGASLITPLMTNWAKFFNEAQNSAIKVNYTGTSSELGIQAMIDRKIDFGMMNVDITDNQYSANPDLQAIPLVIAPLVFGYSIPELGSTIVLPRAILPAIFSGEVSMWNHPQIQAANPSLAMPNASITVLVRQGDSGNTQVLTGALSSFSHDWKSKFGVFSVATGFSLSTANIIQCNGDAAMASKISATPYAIGYMSLNAALTKSVPFAMVTNSKNVSTFPTSEAVMHDLQAATLSSKLTLSVIDLGGAASYPVLTMVYAVVRLNSMPDCGRVSATSDFLRWILLDSMASRLTLDAGYIPLPSVIVSPVLATVYQMECADISSSTAIRFVDIHTGGTTPVGPLMDRWAFAYSESHPEARLTYSLVGSSTGINQVISNTLQFSITDSAPSTAQLQKEPSLVTIPVIVLGVVIVVNLPELEAQVDEQLVFSREVICMVFNGTIQHWNDPRIRRLNPFINFPRQKIMFSAINRASGVTSVFWHALTRFDPTWARVNNDTSAEEPWPKSILNSMTLKSSHETAVSYVQSAPYTIAVVPFQAAYQASARMITIQNRAGNVVTPTVDTLSAASDRDPESILDGAQEDDYPIVSYSTFVLKRILTTTTPGGAVQVTCEAEAAAFQFISWVTENDDAMALARSLGYVPAFSTNNDRVHEVLDTVTCNGQLVIPPPPVIPESKINLIPIVIPIVLGVALLCALAAFGLWKLRKRLAEVNKRLNDVQVAVELSDAIATLDLDRMAFLGSIERRTSTQESCFRIFLTLKNVVKYVPQAVLDSLRRTDEDEDSDEDEAEGEESESGAETSDVDGGEVESVDSEKNKQKERKQKRAQQKKAQTKGKGGERSSEEGSEGCGRASNLRMLADDDRRLGPVSSSVSWRSSQGGSGVRTSPRHQYAQRAVNARKRSESNVQSSVHSGSNANTDASGREAKLLKRGITILSFRIFNFNEMLRIDANRTITAFNSFMERAVAIVNSQSGTIAFFDADHMLIHWNASKRSASARVQACDVAGKLANICPEYHFQASIAVCYGQALYTNIGCDRMSSMAVLGPLAYRADYLHKLSEVYGTAILIEDEVKQQSTSGGVHLVDILECSHPLFRIQKYKIYELDSDASKVDAGAIEDEWLYAFQPADEGEDIVGQSKAWSNCVELYFKGDFAKAKLALTEFIEKFGVDAKPCLAYSFLQTLSLPRNAQPPSAASSAPGQRPVSPKNSAQASPVHSPSHHTAPGSKGQVRERYLLSLPPAGSFGGGLPSVGSRFSARRGSQKSSGTGGGGISAVASSPRPMVKSTLITEAASSGAHGSPKEGSPRPLASAHNTGPVTRSFDPAPTFSFRLHVPLDALLLNPAAAAATKSNPADGLAEANSISMSDAEITEGVALVDC